MKKIKSDLKIYFLCKDLNYSIFIFGLPHIYTFIDRVSMVYSLKSTIKSRKLLIFRSLKIDAYGVAIMIGVSGLE